jgi:hypothetical protein
MRPAFCSTQRSGRINFLCAQRLFCNTGDVLCAQRLFLTLGAWGHGFLCAQKFFDTAVWPHKLLMRPDFIFNIGGLGAWVCMRLDVF